MVKWGKLFNKTPKPEVPVRAAALDSVARREPQRQHGQRL
jgi:hypothetical protein